MRLRLIAIYAVLLTGNLAAWAWAMSAFHDQPVLLGTALLAYSLGLRHAVDADHIAAIDNVTRSLMQRGQQPVTVGLFFSLGHSTVVIVSSALLGMTIWRFRGACDALHRVGATLGTLISASFLLAVAAINAMVLLGLWRSFQRVRNGEGYVEDEPDLLVSGGLLARLLRPFCNMIGQSWHMYPLGLLFGLGFDTATEIGLLGISATQASHGASMWSILVFPALFTAGMSLVDTTDGVLMLGAYGWAFIKPVRKLYYNLTMTFLSVVVALLVGGAEVLALAVNGLALKGTYWAWVAVISDHFGTLGIIIIGVFGLCWCLSVLIYRLCGYDRLDIPAG